MISTRNLCRSFGEQKAVDNLNLNVPRESVYGFLGPNGAGKTTTIRMLLGLIRPDSGDIRIMDNSVSWKTYHSRQGIGALVESPSLYQHLSGKENLQITQKLTKAKKHRVDEVLGIVQLQGAANKQVKKYSLGMQQRLGLANALLAEPKLLILDEPTNGLDPAGIQDMRELIKSLPEKYGITVFVSSHLLSEVEKTATHLGIINKGKMIFEGTLAALEDRLTRFLEIGTSDNSAAAKRLEDAGFKLLKKESDYLSIQTETEKQAAKANQILVENGVSVYHLNMRKPSLEETFLLFTKIHEEGK